MPKAALTDVSLNFMKMGTWDSGKTPLVFVHGLAASSAFWFHAATLVGAHHPVVIYDLRGHGRSSVPASGYAPGDHARDLLGLLDHLGLGRVVLVGHSFGGSVVLQAVLRDTGRFSHLALADTRLRAFQPDLTPDSWPKWREQRAVLAQAGVAISDDEPEAGVTLLTALARLTAQTPETEELPHWMLEFFGQRQSRHTAARWMELVETTSLLQDIQEDGGLTRDVLAALPHPLLAVYGGHSPLLASGECLRDHRPATAFHLVPDAGHFFPVTRAAELTGPLERFLTDQELALA
jgi:pimeloyl-ACP methyl ester carboxylesterase